MILVTGGTGLVGAHLLVALTKEHEKVRAIHRITSNLEAVKDVFSFYFDDITPYYSKIEWIEADIIDTPSLEKAFDGITHVYHAAALISLNPKDYRKMRKINIEGTANIVNFSIAQRVQKLCFVSSVAAVDKSIKKDFIDETGEWNIEVHKSGYAITKHGAEMEVWRASQEGIDIVIVNPGIILGVGFWQQGSGKMFGQINKGLNFYTEGINGFVGVKDVVKIMVQLMNSTIKSERFILVAQNVSFKDVFFQIADAINKKRPKYKLNPFLSQIAWRLEVLRSFFTGKAPLMNRNTVKTIFSNQYYSSEKIKSALNYEFENIDDVIIGTCKEFRQ